MNYYETLYIIHPVLEAGRLKDIIIDVEDNLKKTGGDPLAIELWGKRKLAYFIDKQKYGTYVLIQYNGEGKCTQDFAVVLEHNPNILAYLTTNINKEDVIEQEENLETQIAGQTREIEKVGSSFEKKDANKKIATLDSEKKEGGSLEANEKESSNDEDRQTDSNIEDIKEDEGEEGLSEEDDSEQVAVVAEPEAVDENKSTEGNPSEETKSDQERDNEPSTKNEKE